MILKSFKRILFSTLILLQISLQAQEANLKFEKLTIEDGLSQNSSFCILQDHKGFMWFGTEDGLNKYDGNRFKVYKNELNDSNSISSNYVISMFEDQHGVLWAGTDGGGLHQFDENNENFLRYQNIPDNLNSLSQNRVNSICEDGAGNIWIATNGGGLDKYDPVKKQFKHFRHDSENTNSLSSDLVSSIVWDKSGFLWIGTNNGLNKFNLKDESFTQYFSDPKNPSSLSNNYILNLLLDREGTLWIGTFGGGLNKFVENINTGSSPVFISYKNDLKNPSSISGNVVTTIFEDKKGILWIGTDGDGLNKLNTNTKKFGVTFSHYKTNSSDPNSIVNNRILSINQDQSGVIWIGTKGGGLSKYDSEKKNFDIIRNQPSARNTLSHNAVRVLTEDNTGNLWIGTDGAGLDCYNPKTSSYTNHKNNPLKSNSLSYDFVRSIHQDRKGYLWIGTDGGGINKFNIKTGKFTRYKHDPQNQHSLGHNTIRPIFEDSKGLLWIGTYGAGLDLFDRETNEFLHFVNEPGNPNSISHNYIYSIHEDRSGTLWIGTDGGGLNRYDRKANSFDRFQNDSNDPHSISQDNIYSIYEDNSGMLWLGTRGGGLNKFDPIKCTAIHYTEKDGMPNATVYGILGDDNDKIWISTNRGISRFDPKKEIFKNYDINDGIQSNEFNGGSYFKSSSGELFFGGINGFNRFFPNDIKENSFIPPIVLTSFKVYDKKINLKNSITNIDKIELSYKQNFISFEFASLDFNNPEKNEFAYKLEGFDEDWINCGNRNYANYTNLSGGNYVFKVKGTNSDGIWNQEGTSVEIVIIPPFWNTWWFRILFSIIVILAVYMFFRVRMNRINKQKEDLRLQVKERTVELTSTNKNLRKAKAESQRRAAQATMLNKLGQKLGSNLDLNTLLNEIVEVVQKEFQYKKVLLFMVDKDGRNLSLQSAAGDISKKENKNLFCEMGEGMVGEAALSGQIKLNNDEVQKAELTIPIKIGAKVFGVLDIHSNQTNAFDTTDITTIETFGSQISSAINNARLFEQAQAEIKVRKRTQTELLNSKDSLTLAKKETDNILDNVAEGLFLINSKYKIGSQYSKALERIFEQKKLGEISFLNFIVDKVEAKAYESTDQYMELMFDNNVHEETINELNPLSEIELNFKNKDGMPTISKFLSFKFNRIFKNKKVNELIATVSDISDQIILQRKLKESESKTKNQMEWLLNILHVDPQMLKDFIESVKKEIDSIEYYMKNGNQNSEYQQVLENIYRSVHLIKGNASLLDLKFFVNSTHEFEEKIVELKSKEDLSGKDFVPLILKSGELRQNLDEIHNLINRIGKFHSNFRPKRSYENQMLIKSIENLIKNLSRDIGIDVQFIHNNFKGDSIPYEYRILTKDILIQMVRNTISHGIESTEERIIKNKNPIGTIEVSSQINDSLLVLKYYDDGRGIQTKKLRKKAKGTKKWENIDDFDDHQINELIFESGITTVDKANVVSGRGLGMDIIKRKVKENNGTVELTSIHEEFCEFSISLPIKSNYESVESVVETIEELQS